jgi:hypothetical protein
VAVGIGHVWSRIKEVMGLRWRGTCACRKLGPHNWIS